MVATDTTFRVITELICVRRIHNGRPIERRICYVWFAHSWRLDIATDWHDERHEWRRHRVYTLTDGELPGSYRLHKEDGTIYDLYFGDDVSYSECDCRANYRFGYCVHRDVLRDMRTKGHLS